MTDRPEYWFAAKRYGWGWGLPLTWQGWAVYGLWLVAFVSGARYVRIGPHPVGWFVFIIAMLVILFSICRWKGEPARWRFGD
jgi:hypothetical protein